MCSTHYAVWHRSQERYTITCAICTKSFKTGERSRKCCSTKCTAKLGGDAFAAMRRREAFERRLPVFYCRPAIRSRPPVEHVRTARRLTSGQCRVCASWFVSVHLDVTCSDQCHAAHNRNVRKICKDRRRARKKDAYRADVSRSKVFEADGYRCHLCRRKTDPTKAVPHPRAPTLDHVIPLARGGTHEPSNCRTACYRCNSVKGDRGGGEQLLLAV